MNVVLRQSASCQGCRLTPPDPEVESSPVSAKGSNFCRFWIAELATQRHIRAYSIQQGAQQEGAEMTIWFYLVMTHDIGNRQTDGERRETYTYNCERRVFASEWFDERCAALLGCAR